MPYLSSSLNVGSSAATSALSSAVFSSLDFNGTNAYAEYIGNNQITGSWSIFATVFVRDVSRDQAIICFGNSTSNNYRVLGISYNGGNPRFTHGGVVSGVYNEVYLSGTDLVQDTWYDVMLYGDSSWGWVGEGGEDLIGSFASSFPSSIESPSTGVFRIGSLPDDSNFFDGIVLNPFYSSTIGTIGQKHLILRAGSPLLTTFPYVSKLEVAYTDGSQPQRNDDTILDLIGSKDLTSGNVTYSLTTPDSDFVSGFPSIVNSWEGTGGTDEKRIDLSESFSFTSVIGSGDFSFLVRFKIDDVSTWGEVVCICDSSASNRGFIRLSYGFTAGKLRLSFRDTGEQYDFDGFEFSTTISNGTWYTVAFSRTGLTFDAWLNASDHLDETATNVNGSGDGSEIGTTGGNAEFHLGSFRKNYTAAGFLNGVISQFVLWNDNVVTSSNQSSLYNDGDIFDVREDNGDYTAEITKIVGQLVPQKDVDIKGRGYITNYSNGVILAENDGGTYKADVP